MNRRDFWKRLIGGAVAAVAVRGTFELKDASCVCAPSAWPALERIDTDGFTLTWTTTDGTAPSAFYVVQG